MSAAFAGLCTRAPVLVLSDGTQWQIPGLQGHPGLAQQPVPGAVTGDLAEREQGFPLTPLSPCLPPSEWLTSAAALGGTSSPQGWLNLSAVTVGRRTWGHQWGATVVFFGERV